MLGELRTLSAIEAAYVAGVIDGEGTITLVRMHRGENRRPVVSARARLILQRYVAVTPRNGRYSPALKARREAFEREFFSIRVRGVEPRPLSVIL